MFAYIPLLFAAVAAASEAQSASLMPRTDLGSIKLKEAHKVCDSYQKVVCCNKDWECGEVKFYNAYKNDFLYEHCSSTVVCCDLDIKIEHSTVWGDIENECTNAGTVVIRKEDKKKPHVSRHPIEATLETPPIET